MDNLVKRNIHYTYLSPRNIFRVLFDLINNANNLPCVIRVVFEELDDAADGFKRFLIVIFFIQIIEEANPSVLLISETKSVKTNNRLILTLFCLNSKVNLALRIVKIFFPTVFSSFWAVFVLKELHFI